MAGDATLFILSLLTKYFNNVSHIRLSYIKMFKCFNLYDSCVENMLFSHYFGSGIVFGLYCYSHRFHR